MEEIEYRFWKIWRGPDHPTTARFRGARFGVEVQSMTLEGLKKSIDQRIAEYPWEGRQYDGDQNQTASG